MAKQSESDRYENLLAALDRTALDPLEWNNVSDELAALVGATGGLFVPYDEEERGFAQPHSASMDEVFQEYIQSGWHKRDFRAKGFPKSIATGFVTDQDLISPEEMRRHPYYAEWLMPKGLQWFAGISFNVNGKVWGAAVHGSPARGPFLSEDIEKLMRVRDSIALAAKRVAALGVQRLEALETTFADASRGVVALNWSGRISWLNQRAEEMLREADLAGGNRIRSKDPEMDRKLAELVARAVGYPGGTGFVLPGPLLVPAGAQRLISVDAIPMPRDFRAILSGSAALVTLREVAGGASAGAGLRERFRLTGRETELAAHLAKGCAVAEAAEMMGMSVATARQHLKSILSKTGTHRQAELVALIGRLTG